jgi:ESCRT-II complex subunit VPS25
LIVGKLSEDAARYFLDALVKEGFGVWQDETKGVCLVSHKKSTEWAELIYAWAKKTFMINKICTVYELVAGDLTAAEEFHGQDSNIILEAVKSLLAQNKASLILADSADETGVKFLP